MTAPGITRDQIVRGLQHPESLPAEMQVLISHTAAHHIRQLEAALERATAELISERDCFYDSISDAFGGITDAEDLRELQRLDQIIDLARSVLGHAVVSSGHVS